MEKHNPGTLMIDRPEIFSRTAEIFRAEVAQGSSPVRFYWIRSAGCIIHVHEHDHGHVHDNRGR